MADAIDTVNAGIRAMAQARGIAVVDQNKFGSDVVLPKLKDGFLDVGGEKIDFLHNGDEPRHSRLADGQHLGTVMSGLIANYYFVNTLNSFYGEDVKPLTDAEILTSAGLASNRGHSPAFIQLITRLRGALIATLRCAD